MICLERFGVLKNLQHRPEVDGPKTLSSFKNTLYVCRTLQKRLAHAHLPDQGFHSGAHNAGEHEEGRDQDMEEGQGGKGNGRGEVRILRQVHMDHKRLQRAQQMKENTRFKMLCDSNPTLFPVYVG